jgi:hypothetical protein
MNFWPQGDDRPASLYRAALEEPFRKDESCFQCGIALP